MVCGCGTGASRCCDALAIVTVGGMSWKAGQPTVRACGLVPKSLPALLGLKNGRVHILVWNCSAMLSLLLLGAKQSADTCCVRHPRHPRHPASKIF